MWGSEDKHGADSVVVYGSCISMYVHVGFVLVSIHASFPSMFLKFPKSIYINVSLGFTYWALRAGFWMIRFDMGFTGQFPGIFVQQLSVLRC